MWSISKYIIFILLYFLIILSFSHNYIKFAFLSELIWLCVYTVNLLLGMELEDCFLYTGPIIILLLTAVECIVLWGIIFLIKKK